MQIYFGRANERDVEQFGDEGMFQVQRNGKTLWFYQGVEHGTNPGGIEEVRIFDGCNRSIPISVEQIPELVEALNYCHNNYTTINQGNELVEQLESDTEMFVNDDEGFVYVQDTE